MAGPESPPSPAIDPPPAPASRQAHRWPSASARAREDLLLGWLQPAERRGQAALLLAKVLGGQGAPVVRPWCPPITCAAILGQLLAQTVTPCHGLDHGPAADLAPVPSSACSPPRPPALADTLAGRVGGVSDGAPSQSSAPARSSWPPSTHPRRAGCRAAGRRRTSPGWSRPSVRARRDRGQRVGASPAAALRLGLGSPRKAQLHSKMLIRSLASWRSADLGP
jgi:hypothetical protein